MLNIGWFSTGRGTGSQGLLRFVQERIERDLLDARIRFVFSNRAPGEAEGSDEFFRLVDRCGLPRVTCSSAEFRRSRRSSGVPWADLRPEFDRLAMNSLADYRPDICVLAGYMLIMGGEMCRRYPLLNLHPALPDGPIGTWQEVIWTLIRERATHTGAMTHLATEAVDRGPVVSYCTAPITGPDFDPAWQALAQQDPAQQDPAQQDPAQQDPAQQDLESLKAGEAEDLPLFQQIRQAEYRREPYLLFETLRAVADGKIVLDARVGQVLDSAGRPLTTSMPQGLGLDAEIDLAMARDAAA